MYLVGYHSNLQDKRNRIMHMRTLEFKRIMKANIVNDTKKIEKADLERLYLDLKLTPRKICENLRCSRSKVSYWLDKYDIPKRNISEAKKGCTPHNKGKLHSEATKKKISKKRKEWLNNNKLPDRKKTGVYKICERCNKSFYVCPSQEKRRFCSKECSKNREQVKCICGKVFEAHRSSNRKYCSSDCSNRASKGQKVHPNTLKTLKERSRLEKERNDQKGLDKKSMINSILHKKISPPDLAKQIGVSSGTVINRMREYNINVANYPQLKEIRKEHHAKGNINRSAKTNAKVRKRMLGENNPRWLEGFGSYETYKENLNYAEQIRRAPDNKKILEVKCTYCGRWFKPTVPQASARARYLQSKKGAIHESRFYCSDSCRNACPIFKRIRWPRGYRPATSREVQPQLRQMRLEIDDYTCQKCEKTIDEAELHCHHYTGTVQNPIESADVDNTIILCKQCHKWVHTQEGCRYFELRCGKNTDNIAEQNN